VSTFHSSLDAALAAELSSLRERGLERQLRATGRRLIADFSSNDYLGLATDPRLTAAAHRAAIEHGSGATASRLISGNTAAHEALEITLAEYFGVDGALTFSTGYAANTGIIPALVGRGDVIFADRLNHASLIDGSRLSRAAIHVYPHADLVALAAALAEHRAGHRRALIVTDGMFSMDGDLAPLPELVALAREHDAWLYVDDAHAVGVLGANGRGTAELLGVERQIDVLVGTLGKAFGAAGAFALGSAVLRDFLINRARSFVFSTGPMPAQAAAGREGVRIARDEPELRGRALENARHLRDSLRGRGVHPVTDCDTHIVPITIGDAARTMAIGRTLNERGFLVGAIRPPTVPEGTSRLRLTVSAAHDAGEIESLADAVAGALHT
jgi:8-amino-7-oxononanoate synthase